MGHIVAARQFDDAALKALFAHADYMREQSKRHSDRTRLQQLYQGRIVALLFYEPSTRTRLSFASAAERLGIRTVGVEDAGQHSSAAKGESIEDSTRVIASYVDAIVMRHPEVGAVQRAASVSLVPVLNAGDGAGEHPTQALLDMYTIHREKGRLHNLNIVMGGDLRHGRTVRSLAQLLALYLNNSITFVAPPELQIPADIEAYLEHNGVTWAKTHDMEEAFKTADVVYWTRLQTERHAASEPSHAAMRLTKQALEYLPDKAIIMHPLPRVDEIATEVDADPRAAYFRQAENGLYVRMALLDMVLAHA